MSLSDRDYMRQPPDDEACRKIDRAAFEAEYGGFGARRRAAGRRLAVVLLVLLLGLLVLGAARLFV